MTDIQIKETISKNFLQLIATYNGHVVEDAPPIPGVDLVIKESTSRKKENGEKQFLPSGRELHVHVRTTTEKLISRTGKSIKYNLRIKNYQTLVQSMENQHPAVMMLFVFPDKKEDWLQWRRNQVNVPCEAFWFMANDEDAAATRKSSTMVSIPSANRMNEETLEQLFETVYKII